MIFNSEQTISVKFGMLQVNKVMLNEIEVWSNGTPITYSGEAVLSDIMTAYGYSNLTTDVVENTYATLTAAEQAALDVIGENATASNDNLGVATVTLAGSNSLSVADFRLLEESINNIISDGILPDNITYINGYDVTSSRLSNVGTIAGLNSISSSTNTYNIVFGGIKESACVFQTDVMPYGVVTPDYIMYWFPSALKTVYRWDNGELYSQNTINNQYCVSYRTDINDNYMLQLAYCNFDIPIYNNSDKNVLLGYKKATTSTNNTTYIFNNYYNTSLPVTPEGAIEIAIPYTTDPINDASIPEEEVTLQTVIAGLNILYSFFSDGGSIIMSDNSDISGATTGIHDLVRSTLGYKSVISQ